MDEIAKAQFKWKFYRLTIELNCIILFVAISIAGFIIVRSPYTLPVITGMLALALILSLDFIKRYRETKAWLDDNAGKDKEHSKEDGS